MFDFKMNEGKFLMYEVNYTLLVSYSDVGTLVFSAP